MTAPAQSEARRMAATLEPLIEAHLAEARAKLKPRVAIVPDPDLARAAEGVAEAVGQLDENRYTRGEIGARRLLEQRARALKAVLERTRR